MVLKGSVDQTNSSKNTLNITTFVSIGIVALILLVVFPLLTRIFDRENMVIKFFNNLSLDIINKNFENGIKY